MSTMRQNGGGETGCSSRAVRAFWWICLFILMTVVTPLFAQTPMVLVDTWDSGLGYWTGSTSTAILSNPGGYLNVGFAAQPQPQFASDLVKRDVGAVMVVTNLTFRYCALAQAPSALRLFFHSSKSGNAWYVVLDATRVGQWVTFSVPLNSSVNWINGPAKDMIQLLKDQQSVDWVGLEIERNADSAAQNFAIDDFTISGYQFVDSDGDGIPDFWELQYGLNPNDPSDALLDPDHDGMTNLEEYRAGTNPLGSTSVLKLSVDVSTKPDGSQSLSLKWNSVADHEYSILYANTLTSGFLPLFSGILATPPVNQMEVALPDGMESRFYKIRVDR